MARMPHSIVGSVRSNFNIGAPLDDDLLKSKIWEYLGLTRIYTKVCIMFRFGILYLKPLTQTYAFTQRKSQAPDLEEPVVLSKIRKGTTVKSLCLNVSTQMARDFNYALVWGKVCVFDIKFIRTINAIFLVWTF